MPKHHFRDELFNGLYSDTKWINEQIGLLPIAIQNEVRKKYSDIYQQLEIEDKRYCRRRANTWLRKTVDKYKVNNINNGDYF